MAILSVLLYPHTVDMQWILTSSPEIIQGLLKQGYELEPVRWDGRIESLDRPKCLVHASHTIPYPVARLAIACRQRRHLLFHGNGVMTADGIFRSAAKV